MDARMTQLIQALIQQQRQQRVGAGHGANLSGVGGRALPFSQGIRSPLGVGGFYSAPISFNPAASAALGAVGNASLGVGQGAVGAAASSGAGVGGVLPTDAAPSPGLGASDAAPHYQSDPGAPDASSPYIPPAPSPSPTAGALGSNPGSTPSYSPSFHYGGLNLGDPSDPFNYAYLYRNSFGL